MLALHTQSTDNNVSGELDYGKCKQVILIHHLYLFFIFFNTNSVIFEIAQSIFGHAKQN